ncbi:MAG: hypothetical protein PUF12_08275 [Thermoflexaceae bacterium]|nr:hypothetical protein [Thermoflexaceae bacterium]
MLIKYWTRDKNSLLLSISLIASYLILINCFNGIYSINKSNILKYSNEASYYICDNFIGEKERIFFGDQNCIYKLKELNKWLRNNSDFDYLCIRNQSIGTKTNHVASIQVNKIFFEKNDINVIGEGFSDNDYIMKSMDDELPILLGEDFMDEYEIGDEFDFYYLGSNFFKGIVKGFVSKESCYKDYDQVYSLNSKVIIPLQEFEKEPVNRSEWSFQLRLYLEKNSGIMISEYPVSYLQSILASKCSELQMEPYIIQNNISCNLNVWGLSGDSLLNIYRMFINFFAVMLSMILSLEMVEKLVKLRKKFSIAYYNGYSECYILGSIIIGVFIEIFKPFLIAILIDFCIFRSIHTYLVLLGMMFLLVLVVSICLITVHKNILFDVRGTKYGNGKT